MTKRYKPKMSSGAASVASLFIVSSAIIALGAVFSIYAVIGKVSFSVMGAKIPAVLFAAVVVFLGARYFLATMRLWNKIKGQKFSWKNFKRQKAESPKCKAFWGNKPGSPKSRETFWGNKPGSPKCKTFWGKNQNNVKGEA